MPDQPSQSAPTSAELRAYLNDTHNGEDLTIFCYDHFREVYKNFTPGMLKSQMIQLLLSSCDGYGIWTVLVNALHAERTQQFEKHFPTVHLASAPTIKVIPIEETPPPVVTPKPAERTSLAQEETPEPQPSTALKTNDEWRQALSKQATNKAERVALLVSLLNTPLTLEPPERLKAGDELAELGDPRSGVGLRADGLPDIDWVLIPDDGTFIYGGQNPPRMPSPPPFRISKYLITYAQFQAFIDARDGFHNPRWWKELSTDYDDRRAPGNQWYKYANHPRENASWYDAVAFCGWLSDKLGYTVELPTEEQWEKAARGMDGRAYPWGPDYIIGYANIAETKNKVCLNYLQATSPVGMYPQGKSPYGVLDMSGNVWEWCRNEYANPINTQLKGAETRLLRGGSWFSSQGDASAAYRLGDLPYGRRSDFGFRVVSAPVP